MMPPDALPPAPDTLSSATLAAQRSLAWYCRSDDADGVDGADARRLDHYRKLARNVIADGLESAYPLTFAALDPRDWDGLVYRFFAEHDCRSAQVWQMPLEFLEYVQAGAEGAAAGGGDTSGHAAGGYADGHVAGGGPLPAEDLRAKYPFLLELLAFEWTEVALYMMDDLPRVEGRPVNDWTRDALVFHPEYRLLLFAYPVHLRRPETLSSENKGQYAVLAFRDPDTGEVQFLDLSLLYAWLLEGLIGTGLSLLAFLRSPDAVQAPADLLLEQAPALLKHLSQLRFIRGAQH